MTSYARLTDALEPLGLIARGGFAARPEDDLPGIATVVLVGNAGPALWPVFTRQRPAGPHPLDRWVRDRLTPIAADLGARVAMPNDGPPYHPFQRWAMRAEPVHASPIGLLIHPRFGLWHAYRAALLFERAIAVPERGEAASPCASCADRPCLATCPVGAFTAEGYDAPRCRGHARADEGRACRQGGCLARHACPLGRDHAWGPDQQAFHMASFLGADAARKDPVAGKGQMGT